MATSESKFGISEQPGNTCPDIDGLIDSIDQIGEYDEDGDLIEVDPDYRSIESAQANVDDIKSWQEDWVNVGQMLIDRLDDIIVGINDLDNHASGETDIDITTEKEAYYHFYHNEHDFITNLKEELEEHLEDWKKSIKSDYWDCESAYSDIISAVDQNNEDSESIIESYRSTVVDFRSNGNYFKEKIRDNALEYLPEEIGEPSIVDKYENYLDEEEERKILESLNRLKEKKDDTIENKNKTRKKLKI